MLASRRLDINIMIGAEGEVFLHAASVRVYGGYREAEFALDGQPGANAEDGRYAGVPVPSYVRHALILLRGGAHRDEDYAARILVPQPAILFQLTYTYIDDETYRRRIQTQLNRGEGRHSVARAVFHGQRGELRQRYREGQEDQLGALGLVVNMIALWNTRYMEASLARLRDVGAEVRPEDVQRLSPLGHEHINLLGRYHFSADGSISDGELRPLRDPDDPEGHEP